MSDHQDKLLSTIGNALARAVKEPESGRYCVALSGGLDSTVLLAAMAQLVAAWPGSSLRAVHVDHRLHSDSVRWAAHAQTLAASLDIRFECITLEEAPAGPRGLEAEARHARYEVLRKGLGEGEILLSAHHADDQIETILIQMLRGAGPAGLAAMPLSRPLGHGHLVRPLLSVSRSELADWAKQKGLHWQDDPSNADDRYARNYLRRHVMPALSERWPEAAGNAARSAALCAEADSLLRQLGRIDAESAAEGGGTLSVVFLRSLTEERVRNALRVWIADRGHFVPGHAKLNEISAQVLYSGSHAAPGFEWEGAELRCYRDRLYLMPPLPEPPEQAIAWSTARSLALPGGLGQLDLCPASDERHVLANDRFADTLTIRFRCGGEKFRPAAARTRPLGKWLQDLDVPPWQRDRWPLICIGDAIAWVPGLGPAAQFAAEPGAKGWIVRWQRPASGSLSVRD